ncbi:MULTISPECIES: glucokinase [Larsenimonas]|uniref:Glucokinase n=1 Tax=Larsenimonas suaedae TaxID=1851019 RepID=A0ABU1GWP5_9GAMM|nr:MULTISPECIES: glucokinase [Larsenimonas]MCM2973038.1 glucokinase [Larsenimonas suaedae]MCM5704995.1 glucokinase [Larsenimonas salina]MDR5896475.1 glucokinase [Larsenimonas suaedae]
MTRPALVGDIGGTNARFALVTPGSFDLHDIETLPCADYANLDDAVRAYLEKVGSKAPKEACLAFACPVHDDTVKMTNNPWRFSKRAMKEELGLDNFKAINDFTAMALGLPHIPEEDLIQIGGGHSESGRARLVIGPGTGLGVAGLAPSQRYWIPLSAEGGHASFAPTDDFEVKLLCWFREQYGRVSIERILCGQGLLDLYRALCEFAGITATLDSPAAVTDAAREGNEQAKGAIMLFCKILGDATGDAALTLGARGGVYLCGGVLPRILDFLQESDFRRAFADKGRMGHYTDSIATWVVKAKWTGLLGAAEALHNEEVS